MVPCVHEPRTTVPCMLTHVVLLSCELRSTHDKKLMRSTHHTRQEAEVHTGAELRPCTLLAISMRPNGTHTASNKPCTSVLVPMFLHRSAGLEGHMKTEVQDLWDAWRPKCGTYGTHGDCQRSCTGVSSVSSLSMLGSRLCFVSVYYTNVPAEPCYFP
jgi:hypothetical protein